MFTLSISVDFVINKLFYYSQFIIAHAISVKVWEVMVEVFLKEMILLELVANRNKYGHILDGVKEYRSRSVVVLTPFLWFYTITYLGN